MPGSAQIDQANHSYHCSAGYQEAWAYNEFPEGRVFRVRLAGRNRIHWNGAPISRAALRRHLDAVGAARHANFTMLVFTDETDCALVQEVRVEMTRRLRCGDGRCGEHYTTNDPRSRPSSEEMERRVAEAMADLANAVNEMEAEAGAEKPEF